MTPPGGRRAPPRRRPASGAVSVAAFGAAGHRRLGRFGGTRPENPGNDPAYGNYLAGAGAGEAATMRRKIAFSVARTVRESETKSSLGPGSAPSALPIQTRPA